MDFLIKNCNILKQKSDCFVLSIFEDKTPSEQLQTIDELSNNQISSLIKSGDISGKIGTCLTLYNVPNVLAKKVVIVGLGERDNFNEVQSKKVIAAIINEVININGKQIACDLLNIDPTMSYMLARQFIEITYSLIYRFDEYQTKKLPKPSLEKVMLTLSLPSKLSKNVHDDANLGLQHGKAIANAIEETKTLANQPSNVCNAKFLADKGKQLSQRYDTLKTQCHDEKALAKFNMNAYLAVGKGSENESIMTIIEYKGAKDKKAKPFVLVGKGLTFDSGGISIKPSAGMDEMKYDMCGAATVYGVMQAIAELNLPINVIGIMAGCENMPSGTAYRPGDILTTMSGQTVEVINTDAEGRLVLCDVLTFVERFKPQAVIDIATLTGACIIALGHHYTGVMGNDNELVNQLINASNKANDKAWQLPIDDDFQEQIKSTCADIINAAGRDGGTITAGCFLSRFTKNYRWAHLDIAGTAWTSGAKKGATGRPVAMLVQFLIEQSH